MKVVLRPARRKPSVSRTRHRFYIRTRRTPAVEVAWLLTTTTSHATNNFVTIAHKAVVTSTAKIDTLLLLRHFTVDWWRHIYRNGRSKWIFSFFYIFWGANKIMRNKSQLSARIMSFVFHPSSWMSHVSLNKTKKIIMRKNESNRTFNLWRD